MNLKDIVNRDIVNLENCEQEPIHIPGSIQPHGCLLGFDVQTNQIKYCSGNTETYLGIAYRDLLSKTLEEVFSADATANIAQHAIQESGNPLTVTINGASLQCTLHRSGDTWVMEVEPWQHADTSLSNTYDHTRRFLSYMEQSITLQQLCQKLAEQTRTLTGYDRVMIYRFDESYNGEVFAESVREDLEPFLGLHYPHTDIPAQARELYMRNLLRLIADIGYEPVPIYTTEANSNNASLDLSLSVLRSTSPIHVQYLQNMGVGATLTISLLHNRKLWGLIACHHYSPKNISPTVRVAAQLQGHFLTSQIDMREAAEEYEVSGKVNNALDKAQEANRDTHSINDVAKNPHLLQVCNATGVCISFNGNLHTGGKTPAKADIQQLIAGLNAQPLQNGFATNHLETIFPFAANMGNSAAGICYHPLSMVNDDCIIWFRQETILEKHWGGDPNKAIVKDENGLHPRNSFKLYSELVKNKSKQWLKPELIAAANYAHTLQQHMMLLETTASEARYKTLNEKLQSYNEELENINWISTHDLQEPLRKIQVMSSRILFVDKETLPEKTADIITGIGASAQRMQRLLRDILNYTRAKHNDEMFEQVPLTELVNDIYVEIQGQLKDYDATMSVGELPTVSGVSFLLKQLFTNLISNSIKFRDAKRPLHITISAEQTVEDNKRYHIIYIKDNGIGFSNDYSQSIFKIFSRLNRQSEYEGSGVGLALCKKIMDLHNGTITADATEDGGATFRLQLPA